MESLVSAPAVDVGEYDRFGPWIDEVSGPADVPRLFRDHPVDLDAARLVLKVPRNIARRDATPEMDLYDHLLVLGADDLTVLSRRGAQAPGRGRALVPGGYDVVTVPFTQVVAVRDVVDLLAGRLTIHTYDGMALLVRYNGSARANVSRLIGELRSAVPVVAPSAVGRALLEAARALTVATADLAPGKDDLALVSDLRQIQRAHPGVVTWTSHGRTPIGPRHGGVAGAVQRALHALSPMTLHGGLLAADDVALEVIGRRDWLLCGRTPVHSTSRLVLPFSIPERLRVSPHPAYPDATVVTISAGASTLEMVVPNGSPAGRLMSAAAALLPQDD